MNRLMGRVAIVFLLGLPLAGCQGSPEAVAPTPPAVTAPRTTPPAFIIEQQRARAREQQNAKRSAPAGPKAP